MGANRCHLLPVYQACAALLSREKGTEMRVE